MSRRELRENIFKLLFLRGFRQEEEMPEQLALYFEEMEETQDKDRRYIEEKLEKVTKCLTELDQTINHVSSGWKTSRMSKVDLTILRLAVYELKYDEDVPVKVATKRWNWRKNSARMSPPPLSMESSVRLPESCSDGTEHLFG